MVSGETFHIFASIFAVFSLLGSIYNVFDCAVTLSLQTELESEDGERELDKLLETAYSSTPVQVVVLLLNIISLGTSVMLMIGVFKKKLQLVKIYKIYTIVCVMVVVILGCIILGVLAKDKWWIAIIVLLIVCGIIILPITALIIWILNGEIRFIEQEQEREKHRVNYAQMQRSISAP